MLFINLIFYHVFFCNITISSKCNFYSIILSYEVNASTFPLDFLEIESLFLVALIVNDFKYCNDYFHAYIFECLYNYL